MHAVVKIFNLSCAHSLKLDYNSPCTCSHGHNYRVEIKLLSAVLDRSGMIMDFQKIKEIWESKVHNYFDHQNLDFLPEFKNMNPTAENIAVVIYKRLKPSISPLISVKVWETDTCYAEYIPI
jgi:6-pyruvoyltetrahydropterin/6-carboxytetrahydropterin synthase